MRIDLFVGTFGTVLTLLLPFAALLFYLGEPLGEIGGAVLISSVGVAASYPLLYRRGETDD